MKLWMFIAVLIVSGVLATSVSAQAPEPFKLGTLQRGNETFVGLILRDSVVVNIGRASAAFRAFSRGRELSP